MKLENLYEFFYIGCSDKVLYIFERKIDSFRMGVHRSESEIPINIYLLCTL